MLCVELKMEAGLAWLLRTAWAAGTLPILVASLPFSCLNSCHRLLLHLAGRGKIMRSSSPNLSVPQSFFLHFYILGVAWTSVLMAVIWYYAYKVAPIDAGSFSYPEATSYVTGGSVFSLHKFDLDAVEDRVGVWKCVFLLLLMEIHVLRRLYETLFVFRYETSARMHVAGYLTGMFFYAAAPLSLCTLYALKAFNFAADQVAQLTVEGQGILDADSDLWGFVMPLRKLGWCQWIGAAIFSWGSVHQLICHAVLGSVRRHGNQRGEYVIPHGDWFHIVSSPHYLAEMMIYAGILVASGGSDLTIWLLVGFVVHNLVFAAAETHRWYLQKFEDYPRSRYAVIPYVY